MMLATLVLAFLAQGDAACMPQWRFVYANGPHGEVLRGNRDTLIAAVRRGSPLRVGWGEAARDGSWSVEEFANVGFTNLIGGRELVVQIEPAMIQSNYIDAAKASLAARPRRWHAIIATDGRFDAQMIDVETGKLQRTLRQRTTVNWYALAPASTCDTRERVMSAPRGAQNEIVIDERVEP